MIHPVSPNGLMPTVRPGDEIHLLDGDWGALRLQRLRGQPGAPVLIRPADGCNVRCATVGIDADCHWLVLDGKAMAWRVDSNGKGPLVLVLAESCRVSRLWVGPSTDPGQFTLTEGIELRARGCEAVANIVTQVRRGISLRGRNCAATQNHVIACHEDHVRSTRSDTCISNNMLLDSVLGDPANHNDFIQGWDDTAQTPDEGVLEGWVVQGNVLRNSLEGTIPCQGIGAFNGLVTASVLDNVVVTNHTLGICIGHDDGCLVKGNTVISPDDGIHASIRIRSAKPHLYPATVKAASRVLHNHAAAYDLHPGVQHA